jgi:ABC-2 type transport system ATP-binding protein
VTTRARIGREGRVAEPIIYLEGVTKTFQWGFRRQELVAVDNLSMSIEPGSVVAFIGPNGAGKTTTIFLLLGLLKPDSGIIRVFGHTPNSTGARKRLGFMSEIFHTYSYHTARRAISFYGRLSGVKGKEVEAGIPDLLARVGLGAAVDRKVGTFSKGMTQRLGLAQALFHQPDLLVLDEPTTGLDPEGRRLVADVIAEEQAKGTTVFLSSHILSDVERQCDTVVMIRDGGVVLSRAISELIGRSDQWHVEVRTLKEELKGVLASAGFDVVREEGESAFVSCTSATKNELLRRLVDAPAEIGEIKNAGQSLEDLYMQYVDADWRGVPESHD